ncbi:hypothetical protein [Roseovarius ramblicola]|uniref:Uncharacterized protein n=1 Tax=Roseovarius ramblicola TaxID=2022336 RepID=A0ABV5HWI6_9RHOB
MARALLLAMLVATPALIVPFTHPATAQVVLVLALLAAVFTAMEYNSRYPGMLEFRFAPPYNRLRFFTLAAILVALSFMLRGQVVPTALSGGLNGAAAWLADLVDLPWSPVRLMVMLLPAEAEAGLADVLRRAASLAYVLSLGMVLIFAVFVRFLGWPTRSGPFNVWINLPLFDPTGGGDVLHRLRRDAGVNLLLGLLLPLAIPAIVRIATAVVGPVSLTDPQTLIWTVSAWAFLPASLLMRGIAMQRIAAMIEDKRRRSYAAARSPVEEGRALQGV